MTHKQTKTYRLGSSGLVHTPGFMRMLLHAYGVPCDRAWALRTLSEGWSLPEAAAIAVLSRAVPYRVEGDNVVFEVTA
jgi:hypothetical protein